MFDVTIEEVASQKELQDLGQLIVDTVNKIKGVDSCEEVDQDIDEENEDEEEKD